MRREDLDQSWKVENLRRSLAMLSPGDPGLSRDDSMLVLELLAELMTDNPDQVGLPLRQIQLRHHVDWRDGRMGWAGPEILPVDAPDDAPVSDTTPQAEPSPALPVL